LAIPGVGPFIATGPIVAALSGAAVEAAGGGIAGALIGLGIPEIEAKRYEGKILAGNSLISVHVEDSNDVKIAKTTLAEAGAQDICTTGEAAELIDEILSKEKAADAKLNSLAQDRCNASANEGSAGHSRRRVAEAV
jgi:uncharacterized membrane protein